MCHAGELDVRVVEKGNCFSLPRLWEWVGNWKAYYILTSVSYTSHADNVHSLIAVCRLLHVWYEEKQQHLVH